MAITINYHFWVKVDAPAGFDANEVKVSVDFETDDVDHAIELAERYWDETPEPTGYIDGTLSITAGDRI